MCGFYVCEIRILLREDIIFTQHNLRDAEVRIQMGLYLLLSKKKFEVLVQDMYPKRRVMNDTVVNDVS